MKATVTLVYEGGKDSRDVTIEIRNGLKGERMLDAIDKAVEKEYKEDDWMRWNLVDIKEELI